MQKLLNGLVAFQNSVFENERELFSRLATGQSPDTLLITCSDSRISPDMLLQARPGELFVMRNAGNIIPPYGQGGGEAATLEYAVAVLKVKDIVVLGHSDCGAMKALLSPESVTSLPAVASWLSQAESTRRVVVENHGDLPKEEMLDKTIGLNVLRQLDNLRTHPAVASRLEKGDLRLHAWVYRIKDGTVLAFDASSRSYMPLAGKEVAVAASP
ncbi:MAG: carbonic anhydrase [Candidatus Xenobia bacterium]|jgi:carbonic anhydrase